MARAELDAYYTPDECARGCVQAVEGYLHERGRAFPTTVLEPCVGGGGFSRAILEVWPRTSLSVMDIDPAAPGLNIDVDEDPRVAWKFEGDFLDYNPDAWFNFEAIITNPPYLDITAWAERAFQIAPIVAFLLRSTALGSKKRAEWWPEHRPAAMWTLCSRPKWGGANTNPSGDSCDSVLVLWDNNMPLGARTAHDWIDWKES